MSTIIPSARDTRLDVFRALALLTIYVNHVPGTIYENFTHKNIGFSDAAEAFVLISGIAAGFAYGTKFVPGGRLLVTLKAWRRAAVLYITHIVTTMATLAIFAGGSIYFAKPQLLGQINIEPLIDKTAEAMFGIATLGHQLGYNNILSMYAVVLLMMPAFLLLMRFGPSVALGASGLLWLAAGLWQVGPPNFPNDGVWFLNPLSWQFLFMIGLVGAAHVRKGGSIPFVPAIAIAAFAYVALAFLWVRIPLWGIDASFGLPRVLTGFDKTYLSGPRLLHILAMAYLVVSIPRLNALARTSASNPLAVLGKHALPVFVAGTLIAMAAQVAKGVAPQSLAFDTVLIATGILMQFALAYWLEWLPQIGWAGKKSAPVAAPAPRTASKASASAAVSMQVKETT